MKVFGIDVSKWQGNFNFKKAKAEGVEFAIIKAGGSDGGYYKDPKFERNYKEAKKQGLNVGAYYFCTLTSVNDAKNEAKHFIECIKGKQFELPVYVDVEHKSSYSKSKKELTDAIIEFCNIMEKNGYWVGIYMSKSKFSSEVDDTRLQNYAHWVAQWTKSCTYKSKDVLGMWQFGGGTNKIRSNKVAGVVCDQNYMLVDYPTMIKEAGLNGFKKTPAKTETKTESKTETKPTPAPAPKTIIHTVKKGEYLIKIAKKYGVSWRKIAKDNKIKAPFYIIKAGQKLKINK